jgi:hypothetical protein
MSNDAKHAMNALVVLFVTICLIVAHVVQDLHIEKLYDRLDRIESEIGGER